MVGRTYEPLALYHITFFPKDFNSSGLHWREGSGTSGGYMVGLYTIRKQTVFPLFGTRAVLRHLNSTYNVIPYP